MGSHQRANGKRIVLDLCNGLPIGFRVIMDLAIHAFEDHLFAADHFHPQGEDLIDRRFPRGDPNEIEGGDGFLYNRIGCYSGSNFLTHVCSPCYLDVLLDVFTTWTNSAARLDISSNLPSFASCGGQSSLPAPTATTPLANHSAIFPAFTPPVGIIGM